MKNHVWRPLWVALGIVALILLLRQFMAPADFGIHGRNFTYGFHRLSNIDEWRTMPVKYQGKAGCLECHEEQAVAATASRHRDIQCENCHGPALAHPDNPALLPIDRGRDLCLRCHALLPYPTSLRGALKGIEPATHYPEALCSECHNPHKPDQEAP